MFRQLDIQRMATVLRGARFNPDHEAYARPTDDMRRQREIGAEIVARHFATAIAGDLKLADIPERGFLLACGVTEP